jgi:hypothetical protein
MAAWCQIVVALPTWAPLRQRILAVYYTGPSDFFRYHQLLTPMAASEAGRGKVYVKTEIRPLLILIANNGPKVAPRNSGKADGCHV